ncbi:iron-sulfur cluster assembly protein [Anseongella ginsenosidimutans]|uniref:Iron-sulfur cluster assembly protein n=1 Tax=Anseongella ginsenosidimutans TaxID=496056 RepID=A0A4R3KLV9_9SPHI|nr:iron-sulfur cluster assembly accessory protein [Anseongella ginsenosidimutans]QEC54072.1 iron-sulfur cluster assembly accessory protein [Anseongella ginsenosidimutans]TCS85162.1 iron-sulfur cluster assembly protein [Anseongella ginsenosidimutans]
MATTTIPIGFTPGALKELKSLMVEKELGAGHGLRVGVEGGGCSGMNYILGFDEKKEGDEEFDVEGIRVFLNKAHALYLAGMEIDFRNGLDNRGFTFSNPNASSTCGCGSSFSV